MKEHATRIKLKMHKQEMQKRVILFMEIAYVANNYYLIIPIIILLYNSYTYYDIII